MTRKMNSQIRRAKTGFKPLSLEMSLENGMDPRSVEVPAPLTVETWENTKKLQNKTHFQKANFQNKLYNPQ